MKHQPGQSNPSNQIKFNIAKMRELTDATIARTTKTEVYLNN